MNARPRNMLLVVAAAAVAAALVVPVAAHGVTTHYLTLPAVAFTMLESSTHNPSPMCADRRRQADEVRGVLHNGQATWFHAVDLPKGATITDLTLVARDEREDHDVVAWLARKSLVQTEAGPGGYGVVAMAASSSVSEGVRHFSDTTIQGAVVNTRDFAYFVELQSCSDDNDPIAVRITYTTP